MLRIKIALLFFMAFFSRTEGQQQNLDSGTFNDGIYLTFENFATNSPLSFTRLISPYSKSIKEILTETNNNTELQYHDDYGIAKKISGKDIWGICVEGNVYIQIGDIYSKLEIIGALSYFSAELEVQKTIPDNDFTYGIKPNIQQQSSYSIEKKQYILDFETGKILETNTTNLLSLLEKDKELYEEYKNLNLRQKKKLFFYYVTAFNKKYPIRFSSEEQ